MTQFPVHPAPAAIDDMERTGGRTLLGTLRVNSTDAGPDHSAMMFFPVVRSGSDHALLVSARLAARDHPYVRLELPLTPGGVELADVSRYTGVSFEARGEGVFRLLAHNYGLRSRDLYAAGFTVAGDWQTVRIPFSDLRRPAPDAGAWNRRDVRALVFELSGSADSTAWLELDNVRFYWKYWMRAVVACLALAGARRVSV